MLLLPVPYRDNVRFPLVVLLVGIACRPAGSNISTVSPAEDSTWEQHDQASDSALAARDYPAYLHHLRALEAPLSGHPGVVYGIARAHALLGSGDSALVWLGRYASMDLVRDIARDSAFTALRGTPGFERVAARIAANGSPIGHCDTVLVLSDSTLVIEDVARDPRSGTWYLSSVHQRRVLAVARDGTESDLVPAAGSGLLTPFAIAIDTARNLLWVTSAGTPEGVGIAKEDLGRTAVLGFSIPSGRLVSAFELPRDSTPRVLADIALMDNGELIVSDSRGGGVYQLRPGAGLTRLVAPGTFPSPQGPAGISGTHAVLIADYVRGIARVDRLTGAVRWLLHPADLALNGIDGMRLEGHTLIAVQNGVRPNRVVRLTLDGHFERILRWETLQAGTPGMAEPTHGVFVDSGFVFVANSGWAALGDDGSFRDGIAPERPMLWRIRVTP